ncbi:excalibur calcium-binding domain-containing protein [Phenylobacterium sp. RIFCSPHIGHO2_01_FULL_69_31]|uniref:excalibur calcium-binding domain-containing protein n=1 Tax=Phenylobacterium sp. RIFCSPHIGHO2_01_FULL_69_31 TaxID=1801944 RepID=UPI00341547E1
MIALGLDSLYPDLRPAFAALLAVTSKEPISSASGASALVPSTLPLQPAQSTGPANRFPSCAAAHAAGVYDIPIGSPAYSPRQDGDGDGLACEPY